MQTLPTSCTNTTERKKEKREKQKKKFRETESENNTQRRNREQEIKERNIRNLHNTKEKRGVGGNRKTNILLLCSNYQCDDFSLLPGEVHDRNWGFRMDLMGQSYQDVNVIDREESWLAIYHPFIPVLINLIGQYDDVTFLKAQLALILRIEIIQSATTRPIQRS